MTEPPVPELQPTHSPAEPPRTKPGSGGDMTFQTVVVLLLTGIIVLLTFLWFRERSDRMALQRELDAVRFQTQNQEILRQLLHRAPRTQPSARQPATADSPP